jgi:peptidoglycan/LPS O-acetylase OafA/YrhL
MNITTTTERLFGLDVLRSAAILMVLSSHCLWIYPNASGILSQLFTLLGFWGVELFFVLSGFLIGKILIQLYLTGNFTMRSVSQFLKRRCLRTLPNYYFVLLLNIAIALVLGNSISNSGLYFVFLQNFSTTMPAFFTESWSLSVEEVTYLLLPLCLYFTTKSRNKSRSNRFIVLVIIMYVFFICTKIGYHFTTSNTTITQWNTSLKSVVIYRIDAILIGVIASWLYTCYAEVWKSKKMLFSSIGVAILLFLFAGVGYFKIVIDTHPFFWNVIYLPLTSLAFALLLPFFSELKTAPSWILKPITFISLISYSIYLLHYGIILHLMKYWVDTSNFSKNELHLFTGSYLLITIILSAFWYYIYEKPILKWRDRLYNH